MELKASEESSSTTTTATAEPKELVAARPVPIKGRRRNLGRQARKRRKKYLEIEAAASAFVAAAAAASTETNDTVSVVTTGAKAGDGDREVSDATTTASNKTTVLPTDRGYLLDDVRKRTVLSEADRRDLIRQLGYLPGNALRVVARVEDAFSADDLQRLFAAAAVGTSTDTPKVSAETPEDSTDVTDAANTNPNSKLKKDNEYHSSTDTNDSTTKCNDRQTKEERTKIIVPMIQTMMKEPLVIKLYPLVLRDESSSTKRRRKRRRAEAEDDSTDHTGTSANATAAASNTSTRTTGTRDDSKDNADATLFPSKTTPLMEPFPTIYWVTHPLIKAFISKLELDRINVQFEQRLLDEGTEGNKSGESHPTTTTTTNNSNNNTNAGDACDPSSPLESMKRAHRSYGKERRGLLSQRDIEYVKGRRWYSDYASPPIAKAATKPFSDGCGVAGIRNPKAVKCLHAHAAHYWSGNGDNVVGRWVWERLKSGYSFFRGSIEDPKQDVNESE